MFPFTAIVFFDVIVVRRYRQFPPW